MNMLVLRAHSVPAAVPKLGHIQRVTARHRCRAESRTHRRVHSRFKGHLEDVNMFLLMLDPPSKNTALARSICAVIFFLCGCSSNL